MVYIKHSKNDIDRFDELCETVSELSKSHKKVYVIVPEQLSLQREFSLGARFPDSVCVLGFKRLTDEIFRVFGGGAKKLPDNVMIAAAVYKAVLKTRNKLTYYKSVAGNSGFVSKLVSVFSEFETNRMTKNSVLSLPEGELSPSTVKKYTDLFLIYDEYKSIWQDEYKAPGDDIEKASGILELNMFFEDCAVIFDGFYGFTPMQLGMISQILLQAVTSIFYFTTDLKSEVFLTVNAELKKIQKICNDNDLPITPIEVKGKTKFLSDDLSFIEKYAFFEKAPEKAFAKDGGLTLYSAKNLSDELSYIACKIKNDVLKGMYRYNDIAILAPNPDEIATVATAIFEKHGLPLYADVKRTLLSKPLMAFVQNAISIVTDGFEAENVFAFLKTGLTYVSFDDISVLETYVRVWKIRDKGWHTENWTQSPSGISPIKAQNDDERLEKLNALHKAIYQPLIKFSQNLKKAETCNEQLTAVYDLLESFSVRENLEKTAKVFLDSGKNQLYDEYTRIYDIFIDMLDGISVVFGDDKLSTAAFCDMLSVCAGSVTVSGRPSRIDEVVLAGIGLVREENLKCVYIPCMNRDVIPRSYSDTSLITEADKRIFARHNIPVSMDFASKSARERFDLYIAMTSAKNELVLSMSGFTVTGETKEKSDYVEDIKKLTGIEEIERESLDEKFYLVSVSAASELATATKSPEISSAVYELTGFCPIAEQDDMTPLADSVVKGIYTNNLRLSFSSIDDYVGCPFKFFIGRGLGLRKDEEVEFKSKYIGDFIHAGLERLLGGDYDIEAIDEKSLKKIVSDISDDYYNNDLKDCKGRSKRFDYLFARAKYAFEKAAENVVLELQNSDFVPKAFEVNIAKYIQPVSLGDGYTLTISGKIDRVDMADTENGKLARIIDYKSGEQAFSLDHIYNGVSMQLPIYSGAIRSKYKDVKLAAMYYLKVGMPEVKIPSALGMDEQTYNQKLFEFYVRDGLFSGDKEILSALDKDGRFLEKVKKTSIVKSESIDKLIDFTLEKVQNIGKEIVRGNIAATPFSCSKMDACKYCEYKDICRIEQKPERKREFVLAPDNFLETEVEN